MARSDFNFAWPFRVRYSEVDGQKIVFNAHYLTYFDTAITEYFRALPYDYMAQIDLTGEEPYDGKYQTHLETNEAAPETQLKRKREDSNKGLRSIKERMLQPQRAPQIKDEPGLIVVDAEAL